MKQSLNNEKGTALIIAIMVLAFLTSFAVTMLFKSTGESKTAGEQKEKAKAFYNAESGIQHALAKIKVITLNWTISSDNFTPHLAGATVSNPWVTFLSTTDYVITIKDDNDDIETGIPEPSKDTNRRIYVRSESTTSSGKKKIVEAFVQAYRQDDLSVWYNAIFSGKGQNGKHIDQRVIIGGSVHLLGEDYNGIQTLPKNNVVMTMGDNAIVSNNYQGLAGLIKDIIPDLTTAEQSLD